MTCVVARPVATLAAAAAGRCRLATAAAQVTPAAGYVAARRHAVHPRRRDDLRRLHRHRPSRRSPTPTATASRRTPSTSAARTSTSPATSRTDRVPHHARHRARDRHRQLARTAACTFRLKYAYAQFNLDDWMTRGSWARFGIQQTPWVDFVERHLPLPLPGHDLRGARGLPDVVRRRRVVPLQLRAELRRRPRRRLQRRELQPRRGQRPEGVHDPRHGPAAADGIAGAARPARHRLLRSRRLRQGRRATPRRSSPSPSSTRTSTPASTISAADRSDRAPRARSSTANGYSSG